MITFCSLSWRLETFITFPLVTDKSLNEQIMDKEYNSKPIYDTNRVNANLVH